MMRKGIKDNHKKIERTDTETRSLGHLDLLNLRFTTASGTYKEKIGAGDHQLLETQKDLQYRIARRTKPSKADQIIDQFLLPPKRKNFETCTIKSTYPFSSAGDAGNFPFKLTPSGNLKVNSEQVIFESKKLSVLVASPRKTQIEILSETSGGHRRDNMAFSTGEFCKNSAMDAIFSQAGMSDLDSLLGDTPARRTNKLSSEYESKQTSEILDPELNLSRLGYTGNEPIDWGRIELPEKSTLYGELYKRIASKKNPDCKVVVGLDEFSCHLIVLQCYSELFDSYVAIKKVEIPPERCSAAAFSFIYDWMIQEGESFKALTRENILDIFNASKYLRIKDLTDQCWAFIDNTDVFNDDTAFLLYMNAKAKNMEDVREMMIPRIHQFFLILVSSEDWLELDVEDVKSLLSSNYITVNCEMEVFMSAVRWLKYDWSHRDKYKFEILSCVRFGNIAPWQIVDIKRNPENPEFMELAKDSIVSKLLDDGLAYVIIKHWYGQEKNDFKHWNSMLGLYEPHQRSWSGSDKTYFTYREFLIYLDQYRRNQLIQRNKPKFGYEKKKLSAPAMSSGDPLPTIDDFLKKKVSVHRKA